MGFVWNTLLLTEQGFLTLETTVSHWRMNLNAHRCSETQLCLENPKNLLPVEKLSQSHDLSSPCYTCNAHSESRRAYCFRWRPKFLSSCFTYSTAFNECEYRKSLVKHISLYLFGYRVILLAIVSSESSNQPPTSGYMITRSSPVSITRFSRVLRSKYLLSELDGQLSNRDLVTVAATPAFSFRPSDSHTRQWDTAYCTAVFTRLLFISHFTKIRGNTLLM